MPVLTYNFQPNLPKPLDNREGKFVAGEFVPYADTAEAFAAVGVAARFEGLTVRIGTGLTRYVFMPGTEDNGWDLVLEASGGGGGGATAYAGLTDKATVNLPLVNTPLLNALAAKQAALVSGTNIKTINGETLLGSGDITISGSSGSYPEITGDVVDVAKGYKDLTGATVMTVDPAITDAVIYVFQDATGSRTLSIEGESLTIDTAADSCSGITISYVKGAYRFSVETGILPAGGSGLTQLATPTLTMTADSDTAITCDYTNVANESSYQVQIATDAGFTTGVQTATPAANDTSHQFTGLTASTQYFGRVKAVGDGVSFSDSAYGSDDATTSAPGAVTLNAPTSFAVGTPTPDGAPFTWVDANTSPNESSYLIQITTAADTTYSSVVATRTPAADATSAAAGTGLSGSTNYRARIKAVGNGTTTLDSAYSTEVTFTTDAASYSYSEDMESTTAGNVPTGLNVRSGMTVVATGVTGSTKALEVPLSLADSGLSFAMPNLGNAPLDCTVSFNVHKASSAEWVAAAAIQRANSNTPGSITAGYFAKMDPLTVTIYDMNGFANVKIVTLTTDPFGPWPTTEVYTLEYNISAAHAHRIRISRSSDGFYLDGTTETWVSGVADILPAWTETTPVYTAAGHAGTCVVLGAGALGKFFIDDINIA